MQDTRDRLAGELGKQTGVAVQLSPPQRWDRSARSRQPAVGSLPVPGSCLGCDQRTCARMRWVCTFAPLHPAWRAVDPQILRT